MGECEYMLFLNSSNKSKELNTKCEDIEDETIERAI